MRKEVRRTINENRLLYPGDQVLVAVSGGPDSVCLLHLLHELSAEFPFTLQAAHLDHCLRAESGEEAAFVGDLCARWHIPLTTGKSDIAVEARNRRLGIEETAREVRRGFLRETADSCGCRTIALGHHRGDQAETVLHRLLRGSGATGLAGMRLQEGPFIRPLLEVSRRQILAYLEQNRLSWVEDPSNDNPAFTRNRLRHQVLPLLSEFNPRLEEHLARLGRRLGTEEEFWQQETEKAFASLAVQDGENLSLDCRRLRELHPALRARVLRHSLQRVRGGLHAISAIHLEQLETLLHRSQPQGDQHLPGLWAGRRYERLWLRRNPPSEPAATTVSITGPGIFSVPGGTLQVSCETAGLGEDPLSVEFDSAGIEFPLRVRHFLSGDRFRPAGMDGRKKVKDFFIDTNLSGKSGAGFLSSREVRYSG